MQFEAVDIDLLDYETSMQALEAVRVIFERALGMQIDPKLVIPSRRCPIIRMNFGACIPELATQVERLNLGNAKQLVFNKCDNR